MPCAEAGLMEGATAEEGPLMQKQLLCIGCVLGQGLCSVICIPDFMPTHPDCPGTFTIFTHPQNPPTSTSSSKPGQTLTLQLILSTTRRDSRPLNPILQMEKPKLREVEDFDQGQTAAKCRKLDLDPGLSDSKDPEGTESDQMPKCRGGQALGPKYAVHGNCPIFSLNPGLGLWPSPTLRWLPIRISSLSLYRLSLLDLGLGQTQKVWTAQSRDLTRPSGTRCSGPGAELWPQSLGDRGLHLPPKCSTRGPGSFMARRGGLEGRQAEAPSRAARQLDAAHPSG